jgi:Holliday junction DNA helicase RuvA
MISYLEGEILEKQDKFAVIKAGGVGFRVYLTKDTLQKLPVVGQITAFYTALEIKENAHELYGFLHPSELKFYELLRTVSGVGPKSALAILALAPVKMVASAIASGNTAFLAKVSGIGRKTSEKIILELKEKVGRMEPEQLVGEDDLEVLEALQALGYSVREATQVLQSLPKDLKGTEARVKEALKFLSKG